MSLSTVNYLFIDGMRQFVVGSPSCEYSCECIYLWSKIYVFKQYPPTPTYFRFSSILIWKLCKRKKAVCMYWKMTVIRIVQHVNDICRRQVSADQARTIKIVQIFFKFNLLRKRDFCLDIMKIISSKRREVFIAFFVVMISIFPLFSWKNLVKISKRFAWFP